jgi:hypothetical protein
MDSNLVVATLNPPQTAASFESPLQTFCSSSALESSFAIAVNLIS